jgi:hypothetical protein
MSTTLLGTVTAALLAAACTTALADPPRKHNRVSDVSEPAAVQPISDASAAGMAESAGEGTPEYIQAGARSGSHSMHPNAPVSAVPFADDDVQLPQVEDE